ncbi:MAG: tRNA epoxyqueuosine(34) reductase QueG [Acidobacteria bacterium]|nr:tRNA epoxyqueuosine(34) reductase QueG [Candidatus Sulfomarinibacter sp. MAG AM1]
MSYPRCAMSLTDDLKQRALDEGFDLVGVAAAGKAHTAANLDCWIDAGMHGEMAYMARTRNVRGDPANLLPRCRSVVAVAMSYRTDRPPSGSFSVGDGRVWISRYAWGRDYHRILKKRLVRLGRWLVEAQPGAAWRACVDTAPILEREWAARAGLGWIGKNTMFLNRHLGSELFLGVLLTDVELAVDRPRPEHCGKCTACLDACPTQAFPEPQVLDARRCVGYLTVEHRSDIPGDLQPGMGSMVAGCDICQEVCPWTIRAPADLHPEFAPAPQRYRPRLTDLESLDKDGYREWRRSSALSRIAFEQFRRNLAVARENSE